MKSKVAHMSQMVFHTKSTCIGSLKHWHMSRSMIKPTNHVRPAKTRISLHSHAFGLEFGSQGSCTQEQRRLIRLGGSRGWFRPVWFESSLGAQVILLVLTFSGSCLSYSLRVMVWWFRDLYRYSINYSGSEYLIFFFSHLIALSFGQELNANATYSNSVFIFNLLNIKLTETVWFFGTVTVFKTSVCPQVHQG